MTSMAEMLLQAIRGQDRFRDLVPEAAPVQRRTQGLNVAAHTREETIRLVRQVFLSDPAVHRLVVFSGIEHGSGCTWVCARAAEALAEHVEGTVCLVDAHLRSPALHQHFEIESPAAAQGPFVCAPVRRDDGPSNLWLLTASATSTPLAERQRFDLLRSRLSELRREFTYVLIDAPPINAYADAALLGADSDGLVMILAANDTRRAAAARAKEKLAAAGVRLLGAVLNKRTFPIPEKIYWKL
jgi:receptor protein-tyrosine kinase